MGVPMAADAFAAHLKGLLDEGRTENRNGDVRCEGSVEGKGKQMGVPMAADAFVAQLKGLLDELGSKVGSVEMVSDGVWASPEAPTRPALLSTPTLHHARDSHASPCPEPLHFTLHTSVKCEVTSHFNAQVQGAPPAQAASFRDADIALNLLHLIMPQTPTPELAQPSHTSTLRGKVRCWRMQLRTTTPTLFLTPTLQIVHALYTLTLRCKARCWRRRLRSVTPTSWT